MIGIHGSGSPPCWKRYMNHEMTINITVANMASTRAIDPLWGRTPKVVSNAMQPAGITKMINPANAPAPLVMLTQKINANMQMRVIAAAIMTAVNFSSVDMMYFIFVAERRA